MSEHTKIEIPSDALYRGFEAFAAHPQMPERVGNIALKVAGIRLAIRRPFHEAAIHMGQRADQMQAISDQSGQRFDEQIEKTLGTSEK